LIACDRNSVWVLAMMNLQIAKGKKIDTLNSLTKRE
jgi:hypothetical protein